MPNSNTKYCLPSKVDLTCNNFTSRIYSGPSGLCYEDTKDGTRVLPHKAHYSDKNTVPFCMEACSKKGYKYAGVEYAKECFCGNKLPKSQRLIAECNMDCSGDKSQKCGGGNRINVYKSKYLI